MRTLSIPTLVKINNAEDDKMDFENSQREKKIELDENRIIEKLEGIF
jgi:hypothetical protein